MRAVQARRPVGLPALLVVCLAPVGWLMACAARSPGARAYPELVRFAGREIEAVGFRGGETIPEASSDFPQGSPFDFRRMPMLTAVDTTSAI